MDTPRIESGLQNCQKCENKLQFRQTVRRSLAIAMVVSTFGALGALPLLLLHNKVPFYAVISGLGVTFAGSFITGLYLEAMGLNKQKIHAEHTEKESARAAEEAERRALMARNANTHAQVVKLTGSINKDQRKS